MPQGYHTVTPALVIKGAKDALAFYGQVFDAKVVMEMLAPDGKTVMHAEMQIGDSRVMMSDEFPEWGVRGPKALGGTTASLLVYTPDVDALFAKAVAAGCKPLMPPSDQFWGDRFGKIEDPFGHYWALATRKENLSDAEMIERATKAFAAEGGGGDGKK